MPDGTQWEYRVLSIGRWTGPKDEEIELMLNELGEQGWEAVNLFPREGSTKVTLVAKRPLTHAARRRRDLPGEFGS